MKDTTNLKITRGVFTLFFISLLLLSSLLFSFYRSKDNLRNLKAEIKEELQHEIKGIVRDELKFYIAGARGLSQGKKMDFLTSEDKKNSDGDNAPEKAAYGRLDLGIRELVRDELASYVASGMESETYIAGGMKKKAGISKKGPVEQDESELDELVGGKQKAIERTLVQRGGMLLPKGKLQIEPGFTTAHFSSNRISIQGFSILPVLVIGEISTETVKRDIFIQSLSLKYGLLHNLQGEISAPFRFEHDRVTDNLGAESTRRSAGIGDVSFALSRQIGYEKGIMPDLVASLSVKSNTGRSPYNRDIGLGTGHWAVKGTLIAAKSNDPAVVFGSLGYTWNIKRDINDFGKVDPGNTIGYSLGMALALNYQTAINFQFSHDITFKMKKDGTSVNGSFLNSASIKNGFTWSLSEKASVDFSVSIGLTSDSPDYTVELRFPYYF